MSKSTSPKPTPDASTQTLEEWTALHLQWWKVYDDILDQHYGRFRSSYSKLINRLAREAGIASFKRSAAIIYRYQRSQLARAAAPVAPAP